MSKQQALLAKIHAEFRPHFAVVENESHMHSSGRGADLPTFCRRAEQRYSCFGASSLHQTRMGKARRSFSAFAELFRPRTIGQ